MLDDFGKSGSGGRGRFGVSLGAAVLVFGGISGGVVAASAMVLMNTAMAGRFLSGK